MWARLSLSVALLFVGCAPPLPPPQKPIAKPAAGPPKRDLGPLVAVGFTADRVGHGNVDLGPDGDVDFELRVRVSGDVKSLVLHSSDAAGKPIGGEVWDTLKNGRYPEDWHLPFAESAWSWAIAVFDDHDKPLNPDLELPASTLDDVTLRLFVGDTGRQRFVTGRTYTLIVQRSDGSVDRTTTTIL